MVNKLGAIMRSPIVSDLSKRYCLVCFKKLKEDCDMFFCLNKHFQGGQYGYTDADKKYGFLNALTKKYGFIFPLESKKMVDFYKKDLNNLYNEITSKEKGVKDYGDL